MSLALIGNGEPLSAGQFAASRQHARFQGAVSSLECGKASQDPFSLHMPAAKTKSRARATLAGAIIAVIADLLLLLIVGITDEERTGEHFF